MCSPFFSVRLLFEFGLPDLAHILGLLQLQIVTCVEEIAARADLEPEHAQKVVEILKAEFVE